MNALKLLPLVAIALVAFANKNAVKKNLDLVGKVQVVATANVEMDAIGDAITMEFTESNQLPTENFPQFLAENMREAKGQEKRDHSKDLWGTPYRLLQVDGGFEIQSAGPDKQWGTDDDIHYRRSLAGLGPLATRANAKPSLKVVVKVPAAANQALRSSQSPEETERKVLEFQKRRAEGGADIAQYEMGLRYLEGRGVPKDPALGRSWLQKSADNGNSQAILKLQQLEQGKNSANQKSN